MSLITDKVFYNALLSNQTLADMVEGRIENTTIPVPDDELANTPVPYIIITFDGMQNEGFSKDNSYEGMNDKVQVGIEVAATDRQQLADITTAIRQTVIDYFESAVEEQPDFSLIPQNYTLTASPVQYDSLAPCFFQTLNYNCDTNP